jgi:hypothetical protein
LVLLTKRILMTNPFGGSLMKTIVLATVAIFGLAGVAAAADMYVKAPPPPVVGKAPIGKAPIGKAPLGKGPVVTRG